MSVGAPHYLPTNMLRQRAAEKPNADVNTTADRFRDRFEKATAEDRKEEATTMVNEYYDMVTDFYEYGWGQSFHFAPRYARETFYESLVRHEYFLGAKGGFKEGDNIVDIGCGVGGPARNMVRLTRCNVTGVNNNEYQIERGRFYNTAFGMSNHINYVKTDFCNTGFADNTFDGAYAIEATCHAKDKVECYSEIFRIIKPGSCFVLYEWCTTDNYDPNNQTHREIKHHIELGDSLPDLESTRKALECMKIAGFEIEEAYDVIEKFESSPVKQIPWYSTLKGSYTTMQGFRSTPVGRTLTSMMCRALEFVSLAPKGTTKALGILEEASVYLVQGGEKKIFTPSFYMRGRKPLNSK